MEQINVWTTCNDRRCVGQLIKEDGVWGVQHLDFRVTSASFLHQIAAKLFELNGGNTLQFIEQDDGVINVMDECGDAVGDLVKHNGRFHISFLHTNDNADYLYQIADKLKQLNSDLDS
ncbi:hypothetical protein [Nitrosomonas sp.]|uniref:hypothetical protein n=1 Tax=Nitrosomonas sp. TaxID=42353 RepID=UPI0025E62B13|nr:hypothetical protein [Nitrosomonas sp.]